MLKFLMVLAVVVALAAPVCAEAADNFDNANNENINEVNDGKGVATDNTIDNYGARGEDGSAAANNGSDAYVDNSSYLEDSSMSTTDLEGHISGNAINMKDSHFDGTNEINDGAFKEAKGVSQVSQNSGQNSLIQQSFTIEGNVNADHFHSK